VPGGSIVRAKGGDRRARRRQKNSAKKGETRKIQPSPDTQEKQGSSARRAKGTAIFGSSPSAIRSRPGGPKVAGGQFSKKRARLRPEKIRGKGRDKPRRRKTIRSSTLQVLGTENNGRATNPNSRSEMIGNRKQRKTDKSGMPKEGGYDQQKQRRILKGWILQYRDVEGFIGFAGLSRLEKRAAFDAKEKTEGETGWVLNSRYERRRA